MPNGVLRVASDRRGCSDACRGIGRHLLLHPSRSRRSALCLARRHGDARSGRCPAVETRPRSADHRSIFSLAGERRARRSWNLDLLSGAGPARDPRRRRDQHPACQHHHDLDHADRRAGRRDRRDATRLLARSRPVRCRDAAGVGPDILGRSLSDPDLCGLARLASEFRLSLDLRTGRPGKPALSSAAEPRRWRRRTRPSSCG